MSSVRVADRTSATVVPPWHQRRPKFACSLAKGRNATNASASKSDEKHWRMRFWYTKDLALQGQRGIDDFLGCSQAGTYVVITLIAFVCLPIDRSIFV